MYAFYHALHFGGARERFSGQRIWTSIETVKTRQPALATACLLPCSVQALGVQGSTLVDRELDQYITSWDKTSSLGYCMHDSVQCAVFRQAKELCFIQG
jgi:hypothetical protein